MDALGAHSVPLNDKITDLDILKNPRNGLKARQEALTKIVEREKYHNDETYRALQEIIEFEDKLRYGAFKALLAILPNEFNKRGHYLSWKSIVKHMADSDIGMDEIEALLKKDRSGNLTPIISMAIYRICSRREDFAACISILHDIFCLKEYRSVLGEEQVFMLLCVAASCSDVAHRKTLMAVMSRNLYENTEAVYGEHFQGLKVSMHECQMDREHVRKVKSLADAGMKICDQKISHMVKCLSNDAFSKEILQLLAFVQTNQGINAAIQKEYFKKLTAYPNLLSIPAAYDMLVGCIKRGSAVPEKLVRKSIENTDSEQLGCKVFELAKYSLQTSEVTSLALKIMFDSGRKIRHRNAAAQYILAVLQTRQCLPMNRSLSKVSLEKMDESHETFELCSTAFKCFVKNEETITEEYIIKYYENIKSILETDEDEEHWCHIDYYILDPSNELQDKINLLSTLGDVYLNEKRHTRRIQDKQATKLFKGIDFNIFTAFEARHWRRELLCNGLIAGAMMSHCEIEESYEFYLEKFLRCINQLKNSLDQSIKIEDVLMRLMLKQSIFNYNIKQTIDLLIMLKEKFVLERFFEQPAEFVIDFGEVQKHWLSENLNKHKISLKEGDQYRHDLLLMYNLDIIDGILNKVQNESDFENVLEIVKILHDCDAGGASKENFLNERISDNSKIYDWKIKLCFFAVELGLTRKLKNAHNQALNQYKYTFEDVRTVAAQLMQNNRLKLVLVAQLGRLGSAISREEGATLFLVKMPDEHWVNVAMVKQKEATIVLYKDSFGERRHEDRNRIEKVFKTKCSNVTFVYHKSYDQIDEFSGAVFALVNLEIMAKNMEKEQDTFLREFEGWHFATQATADKSRREYFPKLYAKGCSTLCKQLGDMEIPDAKNAYNQSRHPYKYNLNDITTIASQLMKYHVNNFKLMIVLKLEDFKGALAASRENENETIFLLKISNEHWVVLAVLLDGDEHTRALYKDSLGTEEYKLERQHIEAALEERIPKLKFIYHKSQDQLGDFSSAVFALSNLKIMTVNLIENRSSFIEKFEQANFASQIDANQNRKEDFPKHYVVSHWLQYKKADLVKHHFLELLHLKDLLRSKIKNHSFFAEGEKRVDPCMIISIDFPDDEPLYDRNYKYMYTITAKHVNFNENQEVKNGIIKSLAMENSYSFNKNTIFIPSRNLQIPKQGNLNMQLYNSDVTDDRITDILKRLNVANEEINRKKIVGFFKYTTGYKIFSYDLTVFELPQKDMNAESLINGKLMKQMAKYIRRLFKIGWTFESVVQLMSSVEIEENIEELQMCIDIIWEYKLREYDADCRGDRLFDLMKNRNIENLENRVHNLAVYRTFLGTHIKTLDELGNDILHMNKDRNVSQLACQNAFEAYEKIIKFYEEKSTCFSELDVISSWNGETIGAWSKKVQTDCMAVSQFEKIAVIKRAVEVAHGISPRDAQLLSLILLINGQQGKGRLAEISTGEGKTCIIAMVAALHALDGRKVDVITSSPELALPQAEDQAKFYNLLNLTVSAFSKSANQTEDVIYGFVNEFQASTLQGELNFIKPKSTRRRDLAIVDEVDSMLIDDRYHILKLSTPVPGMNSLQTCLASVWLQVQSVANSIVVRDGQTYYVESQGGVNEKGEAIDEVLTPIKCSKAEIIKHCTEVHLRKILRDTQHLPEEEKVIENGYPQIYVPTHLRELVTEVQIPKWIESAINAKYWYELNKHYIIRNEKIVPLDTFNTGTVQESMYWSNGLHQFLQIKHGAKLTPESLTSNYISNVSFFKQYGKNLFGLTGTLGDDRTKELLHNTYDVDDVSIPPFKQKQYRQLTTLIVNEEKDWFNLIVKNSSQKLRNGRAVLIIARYISETEKLAKMFKERGWNETDIKLYKTDQDSSVVRETLQSGQVIITTNISGRGTDVKVSEEAEQNGGLHVCLTFIPLNSRVQQQNLGRTSRMGNRGSGQFILFDSKGRTLDKLIAERDEEYERSLRQAENEIKRVLIKDIVFEKFCDLLRELERKCINKRETDAVKERFGIWLKIEETNYNYDDKEKIVAEFEKFKSKILNNMSSLISNPYYHLLDGRDKLKNENFQEAIKHFDQATSADSRFTENGYYGKACAKIAEYGGHISKYSRIIDEAVSDYKKARELLSEREQELQFIQRCSDSQVFTEQTAHKLNLLNLQHTAINCAIGVDVEKLNKEISGLEEMKKRKDLSKEDLEKIKNHIVDMKETIKLNGDGGVLGKARKNGNNVEIKFKELNESLPAEDIKLYTEEVDEYKINGFIGEFTISEIKPIPWWSVFAMLCIGLAQLIAGAALTVFSLGTASSFGVGLMMEGVSDIITAVKDGIINRDFSWESWGIQKAISMAVSVVCAGMASFKGAVKSFFYGAKNAVSSGVKIATETVKQGWKIAAKKIGIELAKGVAKEMVNALVDYGVDSMLIPKIQETIKDTVEKPIQNALLSNKKVKLMLEADQKNRNKFFENAIEKLAMEALDPQRDEAAILALKGIALGIADNKIKGFSAVRQVTEALVAVNQLKDFVPTFIERMNKAIDELAKEHQIGVKKKKKMKETAVTTENAEDVSLIGELEEGVEITEVNTLDNSKENKVASKQNKDSKLSTVATENAENVSLIEENKESVEIGEMGDTDEEFSDYEDLTELAEEELEAIAQIAIEGPSISNGADIDIEKNQDLQQVEFKKNAKSSKQLGNFMAIKVSAQMSALIKGKIITPVTRAVTTYGINKMTEGIDQNMNKQIQDYQSERRIIYSQTKGEEWRFDDDYKEIHHDPKAQKAASDIITDLDGGGEAGLVHLGAVSDITERPIKVLDSKGRLKYTIGSDKGGEPIQVQYHEPNGTNPQGHWTLPGGKEPSKYGGGKNDCLFNVVAEQVGREPSSIRDSTVGCMQQNFERVANQAFDYQRLAAYKRTALCSGGARYIGTSATDAGQILDNSQGVRGDQQAQPGHPRGHASNPANITDPEGSAEEYSKLTRRPPMSGFDSVAEQNEAAHYAMTTPAAQAAMAKLNPQCVNGVMVPGSKREIVVVPIPSTGIPNVGSGGEWDKSGTRLSAPYQPKQIVILLQHQPGKRMDPNADVHVHTIYPKK